MTITILGMTVIRTTTTTFIIIIIVIPPPRQVTISPSTLAQEETVSTLQFADRAMRVQVRMSHLLRVMLVSSLRGIALVLVTVVV
jgi:hypothetical protein